MKKTVKTKVIYEKGNEESGDSHLNSNSLTKGPTRIRKRIVLGEKFDYGEKEKEKQNYILYVSGQGQEKTEIEEIEQIGGQQKKKEKIVEEKEIIDNYQYHETKNLKKNSKRKSTTHHERLSSPFERTKIKKYESYVAEPVQNKIKIVKKTNLVDKNLYSRNLKQKNKISNKYNPKTEIIKTQKEKISKIYETYKPAEKNVSTHIITNKEEKLKSLDEKSSSINNYQSKNIVKEEKKIENNEDNDINDNPIQEVNYEYKKEEEIIDNSPSYEKTIDIEGERKTETIKDGEYVVKITTIRRKKEHKNPKHAKRSHFENESKREEQIIESSYQKSERQKSGDHSKRRPFSARQKNKKKKDNISFGRSGIKVGQGKLSEQQSPIHNLYVRNLPEKRIYSKKYKGNTFYTENENSLNNIRNLSYLNSENLRGNRSYDDISKYYYYKKIENNQNFPRGDKKFGKSGFNRTMGRNFDYNYGMPYTNYKYYEEKNNEFNNYYEDNVNYWGEQEGMLREVYCPVHGRQIIRTSNYNY